MNSPKRSKYIEIKCYPMRSHCPRERFTRYTILLLMLFICIFMSNRAEGTQEDTGSSLINQEVEIYPLADEMVLSISYNSRGPAAVGMFLRLSLPVAALELKATGTSG